MLFSALYWASKNVSSAVNQNARILDCSINAENTALC